MRKILEVFLIQVLILFNAILWPEIVFMALKEGLQVTLPLWVTALFIGLIFILVNTLFFLNLMGEPIGPALLKERVVAIALWMSKIGYNITPSANALFVKLYRAFKKYDVDHLEKIRNDISKANINYLKPLESSSKNWGELFTLWAHRLPSNVCFSGIRWGLFSDLYLYQEVNDLNNSRFVTDLNLYAKTILLNSYLSLSEPKINGDVKVIWVFTKMLPTDWPLCNSTCSKDISCLRSSDENKFLNLYIDSLQQFATKPDFDENTDFCRHMVVVNNHSHDDFKTIHQLTESLRSHSAEYFNKLHTDKSGHKFGRSFSLSIDRNIAYKWPDILNDAVFYGTRLQGAIKWNWAICTTYTPNHPAIILRLFDISETEKESILNNELKNLYDLLGLNNLSNFTHYVETKRTHINETAP